MKSVDTKKHAMFSNLLSSVTITVPIVGFDTDNWLSYTSQTFWLLGEIFSSRAGFIQNI